jgi:hypothetical protein
MKEGRMQTVALKHNGCGIKNPVVEANAKEQNMAVEQCWISKASSIQST